jgi:hypothetical protein
MPLRCWPRRLPPPSASSRRVDTTRHSRRARWPSGMRQGRWRGGSRLHWIRCRGRHHRHSVALRRPPLRHRRRLPPVSSLPHQLSSTSLTMPASRWPGSLPTDGYLRLPPLQVHHPRLRLRLAARQAQVCLSRISPSMRDPTLVQYNQNLTASPGRNTHPCEAS